MLDYIFHKLANRIVGKQREAEKWTGRLCPKIQKKLDKYVEWAKNCRVKEYGKGVFQVMSLNNTYVVDLNMNSSECKRWELSAIPCHHAIACFRHERIEPKSMVHECYTVENYKDCNGWNLMPISDMKKWEKMHGIPVFPPIYTKVMGRPKKNRKKEPEEKQDKNGLKKISKHGVTMHYSICGAAAHNKKGHHNHLNEKPRPVPAEEAEEEEDYADQSITANIMPHRVIPQLDPTQRPDCMVYKMQEKEKFTYPTVRDFGPLPESTFIANARDSIPVARVTTAMASGMVRRNADAAAESSARKRQARGGTRAPRGGRSAGRGGATAPIGGRSARRGGTNAARGGRNVGRGETHSTTGGTDSGTGGTNAPRGARAAAPGFYNLLFVNDGGSAHQAPQFMQAEEEVLVSQNAPNVLYEDGWPNDLHDFLSL
ncbi:uncharacterized protein [Triticum aestivum]|uniref:uncharacterized protein isoform X2 n=1 Tax=Triticum aestivum TaxID=4565 RepID=UPI001D002832|nr:uncharacterized protein LOC123164556 isoform X2 [Triticum aestivum]